MASVANVIVPDFASSIGNATAFPILRSWNFFNHAGVSPLPHVAAEAMRTFVAECESAAYIGANWYRDIERLRDSAAGLINAHRDEIAFIHNTSEGLATVAAAVEWRPGDRIVTTAVEYPANVYPWMDVARRRGVELEMIPEEPADTAARRVPPDRILAAAAHERTRLVSLSHVEFASGQRHDLATIGRFCRDRGILFCVDAIQSLGVLPVDVQAMNIDYLSADGHKWLLGPEGAGIFYCRRELLAKTHPLIIGWMNVVDADDYGTYDFTLKEDARRFEGGSHNVAGLLGLKASLEMLQAAGVDAISQRLQHITDRLITGLLSKGYLIISPRGPGEWSGIVSFLALRHDQQLLWRSLRTNHHIELAVREGRLRCSPHFYNTEAQIDRLIELLPEN